MKKNLFILILLGIFIPLNINAQTYYTNYSLFKESNKEILKDDLTFVETYQKFKYYDIKISESKKYYLENKNEAEYPYRSTKKIETKFSDYNLEKPDNELNRIIKEKTITKYKTLKDIRYIYLFDFKGPYGNIKISEIEVLNNDKNIEFTIIGDDCDTYCQNIITNKIKGDYPTTLSEQSIIKIDLQDNFQIKDLLIKVCFHEESEFLNYQVSLGTSKIVSKSYINKIFNEKIKLENNSYEEHIIKPITFLLPIKLEDKIHTTEDIVEESSYLKIVKQDTYYSYRDVLYKYFKYYRDYLSDYYIDKPGFLKDANDFINIYKYKTRDFIEVNDNIEINSYIFSINDIVKNSNIDLDKIKLESNINVYKNDIYNYKLSYKDISINNKITVKNSANFIPDKPIEDLPDKPIEDLPDKPIEDLPDESNEEALYTEMVLSKDYRNISNVLEKHDEVTINKKIPIKGKKVVKSISKKSYFPYKYALYLIPSFVLAKKMSKYVL